MSELKERLRELRGQLSQKTAAERAGISQQQWSKMERGEVLANDTSTLPRIVNAFAQYRLEWLVHGTEPKYTLSSYPADREIPAIQIREKLPFERHLDRIIDAATQLGPGRELVLEKIADLIEQLVRTKVSPSS